MGESPVLVVVTGLPGTGKTTVAGCAGRLLGGPVLAHDWAMSGVRPFPAVEEALASMDPPGHGAVGWSVLRALARQQLRAGSSVVLDGVARDPDLDRCRAVADDERSRCIVVLTECADRGVHRARIEGRRRGIPGWYELTWDDVERSRARWDPPATVDLRLEATRPLEDNVRRLAGLLADWVRADGPPGDAAAP